jgi:hypothetical protein
MESLIDSGLQVLVFPDVDSYNKHVTLQPPYIIDVNSYPARPNAKGAVKKARPRLIRSKRDQGCEPAGAPANKGRRKATRKHTNARNQKILSGLFNMIVLLCRDVLSCC